MTRPSRGPVQRVAYAFDNMVVGTIGVGFPATAIYQSQLACLEVLVQNDPASSDTVFIGNEFGQPVKLIAGANITIPINNVNKIYACTAEGGSATVNWIAMT